MPPRHRLGREFRLLAAGQALSWTGTGFQTVAIAVAVVTSGGGAGELGLVTAASVVALLACTLFGGVWADRVQPQRVMVLSDLVRFAASTGLAVAFSTGHHTVLLLSGLVALSSGAGAFFSPAMSALKPTLVPVAERQAANALLGVLQTSSAVAGPALGGVTVAAMGPTAGFAVNAASFLASVGTVVLIRTRVARARREGMLRELAAGWSEVWRRSWLRDGVLAATVYHVANGAVLVLIQIVAIRELGGARAAGFVAAAEGLGGVVGAGVALRVRPVRLLRSGWIALLLMPLWVLGYVWPADLGAVVAGAVLGYAGLSFFSVAWETAIQDHVPHRLLARVASWDTLASFLGMPVGAALAGPLSVAFGIDRVLVGCAAVLALASVGPLLGRSTRTLTRIATAPEPSAVLALSRD